MKSPGRNSQGWYFRLKRPVAKLREGRYSSTAAEKVRHDGNIGIAGVVQAREPESRLDRLQEREAVVVLAALHAPFVITVGFHGEDYLVLVLRWEQAIGRSADAAIVVLIPNDDDGIATITPCR